MPGWIDMPAASSAAVPSFTGALYFYPESVNQLADELRGTVPLEWEPHDTDFGTREFAIRDPNGYPWDCYGRYYDEHVAPRLKLSDPLPTWNPKKPES